MMLGRCDTCRFGHLANPTTIECRRHAPTPILKDQKMEIPRLPLDFWCGEFEKAAVSRKAKAEA